MAKFEQILSELFGNILKQSFKNCNKNGEYPSYRRRYSLHCFQVVQNLFGKVSIFLQKAPNLGRFKKT